MTNSTKLKHRVSLEIDWKFITRMQNKIYPNWRSFGKRGRRKTYIKATKNVRSVRSIGCNRSIYFAQKSD